MHAHMWDSVLIALGWRLRRRELSQNKIKMYTHKHSQANTCRKAKNTRIRTYRAAINT